MANWTESVLLKGLFTAALSWGAFVEGGMGFLRL
jgi:hypothetical protein